MSDFCLMQLGVVPSLKQRLLVTLALSCLLAVVRKAVLAGKYSTEWFSVMVPGGACSQGCHGYFLC